MINERDRYERAFDLFDLPEPSWDRLLNRRDRKRRNSRLGAAIVAIVLAAATVGVVWKAFLGGTVPASLPDTPSDWTWHDLAPGQFTSDGNGVSAIASGGQGLIAVGSSKGRRHRDGYFLDGEATVWSSRDGLTWTRIAGHDLGLGRIRDVTLWGGGFVAVGSEGGTTDGAHNQTSGFQDYRSPVVWTSRDGEGWTRLPDVPSEGNEEGMEAVARSASTLVAVGWRDVPPYPAAWWSTDGTTWRRAEIDGTGAMTDVTAFGKGFVAVGSGNEEGSFDGANIWTSADGSTWTSIPQSSVLAGLTLSGVADGPDGLVAVGWDGDGAAVLTSHDGRHWQRVDPSQPGLVTPRQANAAISTKAYAVTSSLNGYVAVGSTLVCPSGRISCSEEDATVWTSADGKTWTVVEGAAVFANGSMNGVTTWGLHFVAVGVGPSSKPVSDLSGTVWISK